MALFFMAYSPSYLAKAPLRDQEIDRLISRLLSSTYEVGRGQRAEVERHLVAAGYDLSAAQVTVCLQRTRRTYLLLTGEATEPVLQKARMKHSEVRYYQYLVDDGITSWSQVMERSAESPPLAVESATATHVIVARAEFEDVLREIELVRAGTQALLAQMAGERQESLDREAALRGELAKLERKVGALRPMSVEQVPVSDMRPIPPTPAAEKPVERPASTPPAQLRVARPVSEEPSVAPPPVPRTPSRPRPVARPTPAPRPGATPGVFDTNEKLVLCGRSFSKISSFGGRSRPVRWSPRYTTMVQQHLAPDVQQGVLDQMELVIAGNQAPGKLDLGFLDEAREKTYNARGATIRTAKFLDRWLLVFILEVNGLVFQDVLPILSSP